MAVEIQRGITTKQPAADRRVSVTFTPEGRVYSGEFPKDPAQRFKLLLNLFYDPAKADQFLRIPDSGEIRANNLVKLLSSNSPNTATTDIRYCIDTNFLPAGLVTERSVQGEPGSISGETYYRKTEYGQRYGSSATTLSVNYQTRRKTRLRAVFGAPHTSQDGITTSLLRAEILLILSRSKEPLRRQDVHDLLPFTVTGGAVGNALLALDQAKVITYSSVLKGNKIAPTFELTEIPDTLDLALPENVIKQTVLDACRTLKSEGIPITRNALNKALPTEITTRWSSEQSFENFLARLVRDRFLRKNTFTGNFKFSAANITEEGLQVVNEFLLPLKGLANDSVKQPLSEISLTSVISSTILNESQIKNKRDAHGANLTTVASILGKTKDALSIREIARSLKMPRTVVDSCIKQLQQIGVIATESRGNVSFYLLDSKDITARHIQIITAAIPRGTDLQELVLSIAVKNRLTLDKTKQLAMLVSGVRTVVKAQRLIHESTIQTFDEEMKAAKRLIEDAMSEGRYTPEVEQISSSMQTVNKTRVSMKNTEKRSVIEQSTKEQEQLFSRIDNIRSQLIRFTMRYARVNIDNAEDIVSQTTLHAWKYARTHDLTGIDNTGLRKLMIYMVKRTAITFLKNPQGSRGLGEKAIIPTFISISDIEAENGSDTNSYFRYRKQLSQHEKGYTDIENADEFKQNFKFKFSIINMPTKQRQVIILRTLFSLSLQEIAQILNINMVTTEAHSYQASLVLKNALT